MVVPAATVSDAAVFKRDSVAVGKEAGAAADGTRSLSRRVTISRMFLRLTCIMVNQRARIAVGFTDHAARQLERPHAYTHVLVVQACKDIVLIVGNEMRMRGNDLDHGQQRNIFDCSTISRR